MRTRTTISLEKSDMANINRLHDAVGLTGGKSDMPEEDRKVFSYINSNDFTLDDVRRFVQIIRDRATAQLAMAEDTPLCFVHSHQRAAWVDGVRGNDLRAVQLAEEFLANVLDDLSHAEHNDRREYRPREYKKKKTVEAV